MVAGGVKGKNFKWVKVTPPKKHKFIKKMYELRCEIPIQRTGGRGDSSDVYAVGTVEQWDDTPKGLWAGYTKWSDDPVIPFNSPGDYFFKFAKAKKLVEKSVKSFLAHDELSRNFFKSLKK